jgi:hypothetical protein
LSPEKEWKTGLVVVSLLLYAGSIAALALLFVYFNGDDDTSCPLQTFFISWTLIQTVIPSNDAIPFIIAIG